MDKLRAQGRARDILNAFETDGDVLERAVYDVVKGRSDLAEQIYWAAAKHIARQIVLEERTQFTARDQPKPKSWSGSLLFQRKHTHARIVGFVKSGLSASHRHGPRRRLRTARLLGEDFRGVYIKILALIADEFGQLRPPLADQANAVNCARLQPA
jgi:hypothetical protein